MSAASQANILAAAQVASTIATTLGTNPSITMTPSSVAAVIGTVLQTAGPALSLDPKLGLIVALASLSLKAYDTAVATGEGLTQAQWALLIGADDAAIAADKAAHPAVASQVA